MRALVAAVVAVAIAALMIPGKTLSEKEAWVRTEGAKRAEGVLGAIEARANPSEARIVGAGNSQQLPARQVVPNAPKKRAIETGTAQTMQSEQEILKVLNRERSTRGLRPLALDDKVSEMARLLSVEILETGVMTHNSPKYGNAPDVLRAFGVEYAAVGGAAFISGMHGESAEVTVRGWLNSPPHRKQILDPDFERVGLGIARVSEPVKMRDSGGEVGPTRWVVNALLYTPAK